VVGELLNADSHLSTTIVEPQALHTCFKRRSSAFKLRRLANVCGFSTTVLRVPFVVTLRRLFCEGLVTEACAESGTDDLMLAEFALVRHGCMGS
jgi:hypothetical protein